MYKILIVYIRKGFRLANAISICMDFENSLMYILDVSARTLDYTHELDGTCQNEISGYTNDRIIVYKNSMFVG